MFRFVYCVIIIIGAIIYLATPHLHFKSVQCITIYTDIVNYI